MSAPQCRLRKELAEQGAQAALRRRRLENMGMSYPVQLTGAEPAQ